MLPNDSQNAALAGNPEDLVPRALAILLAESESWRQRANEGPPAVFSPPALSAPGEVSRSRRTPPGSAR